MAGNVVSWGTAIRKGYTPGLYTYEGDQVPMGAFAAVLDFKIWAKKVLGINCYFTAIGSGQKFQLTVYCQRETGLYRIRGGQLDFTQCPVKGTYSIRTVRNMVNGKSRVVFVEAELIG